MDNRNKYAFNIINGLVFDELKNTIKALLPHRPIEAYREANKVSYRLKMNLSSAELQTILESKNFIVSRGFDSFSFDIEGFDNQLYFNFCCPLCGRTTSHKGLTEDETGNLEKWARREMLIQEALPNRNKYEREIIRYIFSGLPMIACSAKCIGESEE